MNRHDPDYPRENAKARDQVANELADTATDKLKDTARSAKEMAAKVSDQARKYGERAQDAARQAKPLLEKSLREQPLVVLAGAAAIGFLLGALWKK